MAPELLFDPKLDCRDIPGLHHFALECIHRADIDLRPELCGTVNFSGGGTMMPNFVERFQAEMEKIVPEDCIVNTVASEERQNLCWIGGSVLTSLESFEMMWIEKSEYEEHGMSILKKKVLL
jgi:actin-related protein